MCSHRIARLLGIATLHRLKNALVMNLAAFGPAGHAEYPQALLSQEADDGVEEREYQRISRTFCEGEMKIEISFDVGFRILARTIHD